MVINARGVEIYVEQQGTAGPNVLLLHGWGCSVAHWQTVMAPLSARARVTAIDFPGHGQSGRPPEPWGATEHAEMVAEVIETLGIQGCDIIGHSHGGRIALRLAIDRPELIGRLVLTGAAGLRGEPTQAQKKRQAEFRRLRTVAETIGKVGPLASVSSRMQDALRKRYGSADYNALDEEMRGTFVRLVNTDLTPELGKVQASTLLIWGSEDTETPLWMGQRMEADIPDAGLVVLKGGSHFAYLEKHYEFMRIIEHFLLGGTE